MRDDNVDAAALRNAARVLRARSEKQPFALRVVTRTLDRAADRIEAKAAAVCPKCGTSVCLDDNEAQW